jgi:hypothetical protein
MTSDHNIGELVEGAYIDGELSMESIEVLRRSEVAKLLPSGLGSDSAKDAEILLVTIVADDSDSIRQRKATKAIREGHNRLVALLRESPSSEHVFVTTRFLNGTIINPFVRVQKAVLLDERNYSEANFGGTPLHHQAVVTLGTVMLQTQVLEQEHCRVRSITLIISDGEDSMKYMNVPTYSSTAAEVAFIARDMSKTGNHLLAAYAVGDDKSLISEFLKMGIERKWVLTSPDALGSLLEFAKAAVTASLGQKQFEQLLLGPGFTS